MDKVNNQWLDELALMVRQVKEDVLEIAQSCQYPALVLLRGYELLECLSDVEKVNFYVGEADIQCSSNFKSALEEYQQCYLANGEKLYAIMDMAQVKMKAAAYMGPWKKRHNDAVEEVRKAEELLEAAKAAHKAQEEGGFLEKRKTLRQVRQMAGFRLERKRTGNFVTRCTDMLHQAQMKARNAELNLFAHNIEHKCSPDTYLRIFELINNNYL